MNLKHLRPDQQQKPHARWNYQHNSKQFVGWVNRLGIERTWLGRVAHYLDERFCLRKVALLFIFSLALSFLVSWDVDVAYSDYKEGELAVTDIKSPMSFDFADAEETSKRRQLAEESIPAVFDYDVGLYDKLIFKFGVALRNMRGHLNQTATDLAKHQDDFEADLGGIRLSPDTFRWLVAQKFKPAIGSVIEENLSRWGSSKIIEDLSFFTKASRHRIIVNILERGYKGEEFVQDTSGLVDIGDVRQSLLLRTAFMGFNSANDRAELDDLLRTLVMPNLTLNKQETEIRKTRARDSVPPYMVQVKKGQVLVHAGQPLQRLHVEALDELTHLQNTRHQDFVSLITAVFFVMLLLCFGAYITRFMSKVKVTTKDAAAMGAILFVEVLMIKFGMFVANNALADHFTNIPPEFYVYLMPVSFGAMMTGLLIPYGEVVWLFSLFLAVVVGFLIDRSFTFTIISFTASIVAARGVYGCKKREDLYKAGLRTGLVSAGLIACATLMNRHDPSALRHELIWNAPAGFISGIFSCFIALTLIPLWETLFVYTTDVKLLELSNLNHPLLKELIVQAPGTYHHSLVVGSMCEAAAEAIGANPLLAKVCAYYHDIGKTDHAIYFIENQRQGENRHDHINPGMSKTILIAHVKDGVDKGLKYKLGKPIIDVIEQHHGTTLISFFYHKAKEHENSEMHEVGEDEYRYPGPKPQFREAALCMLADSIEAAARTLDEPTPARLQSIVHNIVQKKFIDGQLDECDITLKDLNIIEEAFARILYGIYHHRIDYPSGAKPVARRAPPTPTTLPLP